jgi:hypothetical protein
MSSPLLHEVQLHLTKPQLTKLRGGKVFQIKHHQFIQGEGLTATKFMVDKKMLTKLNASQRKGKGMRMLFRQNNYKIRKMLKIPNKKKSKTI